MVTRGLLALVCAGAWMTACGSGGSAGTGPAVDPTVTGSAVTCEARSCAATVAALNTALGDALDAVLSSSAEVSNNLYDTSGGNVGGPGVVFHPRPSDTGTDAYEAALLVRDGDRTATLNVKVERYHEVPSAAPCRSDEMVADAVSKGIVILRCDRTEHADGTVVLTSADDYPADLAQTVLVPSRFLSVYRTDGVMVQVGIDAQAAATPPAGLPKGATVPSLLSLEELALIANDPGLTVLS